MKNIKILFLLLLALFTVSCEKYLETEAKSAFDENLVYSSAEQVEKLLFSAYNSTEGWAFNRNSWWGRRFNIENASFEAKFNFKDLDRFRVRGGWTPSNAGDFDGKWAQYWTYMRMTNEFLGKIDNSVAMEEDPDKVNILKAEMRFLRANICAKLIKFYGGVPIMERALGLSDDFNLVRNSYEECVDFIVKELDEVVAILPATRSDAEFGRATKLSALAVKSRTLLYAASKLHDPAFAPSKDPLYVYTKTTKWQDAANAAKAIIDIVAERNLRAVSNAEEYQKMFLSPFEDILFARPYGSAYYEYGTDPNSLWDQTMSPSGYGGWALSSPTHNFTLQFNMKDGTTTSNSGYDSAKPNENREMRYYANLLFNGAQFRGRKVEYFLAEVPNEATPHGKDSQEGLGNQKHSSRTGYNIRKFQDESIGLTEISATRPYVLYRLAEIYLNYAEAQFHMGDEATARKFLNKVSRRALQPEITAVGDALLEAIQRERRVELCFEGHNFFDERRWMKEEHLGMEIKGLKWTLKDNGSVENEEYTVVTRPWKSAYYYLPIPQTEIEKAPKLKQNYGY